MKRIDPQGIVIVAYWWPSWAQSEHFRTDDMVLSSWYGPTEKFWLKLNQKPATLGEVERSIVEAYLLEKHEHPKHKQNWIVALGVAPEENLGRD